MKNLKLPFSSILLILLILSSCAGGPTSESYDNLNAECDYVDAIMDIINYLEEEFASELDAIGNDGLDAGNFDEISENRKQDLCHSIIITECLKQEFKDRARGQNTSMTRLNFKDLQNCPNYNKMAQAQDDLEDLLRHESLIPYASSFPPHLQERFSANSHVWEDMEVEEDVGNEATPMAPIEAESEQLNLNNEVSFVIEESKEETYENEEVESFKSFYVDDSDGWVNLRDRPNGEIIKRVDNYEVGVQMGEEGDWILLRFYDGTEGFIHNTRLKEAP